MEPREDENRLYRLNGVAHVAGYIDQEPSRVISAVRRQQNMPLHDRIIPYLETAGLYHLGRLNSQWFWVDESLLSAFIERWRPETHTFHMPFGECTITLQDVAYQLGLPIDGVPVSGCLTEFENLMEHGRPAWVWFQELFGELPPQSKIKQMTVCYTWFHERFRVLPADATDETVRVYARAYILMLLSSQLFADKNANRVHLRWLPYLASLDDLGRYSWGSAALAWLYRFPTMRPTGFDRFGFPLASRWAEFVPRNDAGAQRLLSARLALDRLRVHDFVWEPYSSVDVGTVIHPEILADEHRRLWTTVTSLIYFAAIEWHQVDRVLPQFGGVQHLPQPALNIDWLHAKDGRGGDRWFPSYYREWHQHWEDRLQSVIWVDRVLDPGPSSDYLDWWCRVAHRFLSPDVAFQDPRPIVLTEEARHRGSSQAPPRVHVYDRPDNRRVDRRRRIGTRTTDREWREFAERLEEDVPAAEPGDAVDYRVPRRRGRRAAARPNRRGAPDRAPSEQGDGSHHVTDQEVVGSASAMDQPTFEVGTSSQLFGNVSPHAFAQFTTAAVGMDIDDHVTESEFYMDIADMLRDDYRPQMPAEHAQFADQQPRSDDVQAQLPVDLNEPAGSPFDPWFALGGTSASAFSAAPAQPSVAAPDHRPRRVRRPPLCGTGGHLIGQLDDADSDTIEDSD
ncbi:uncharacterized protein DS421_19g667580 [Arachis hypogaea]|uniref:Aminotransferase-like plant mobile domain-containing protein n=1 Tax=Arachis hypogaea TaxID=3818 RepID=A0A6B9VEN7_ARAHY|nr:uncharacterized protein DS421_19g667580 [Arachis hypogaea]